MQWPSKHSLDETTAIWMFDVSYQGPTVNMEGAGVIEIIWGWKLHWLTAAAALNEALGGIVMRFSD